MSERNIPPVPRYAPAEHWIGDAVYLKVRDHQEVGMITGIIIRPHGILYLVQWEDGEQTHYGIELTADWDPVFGKA